MEKTQLAEKIARLLPTQLTEQEKYYLYFYPTKTTQQAILQGIKKAQQNPFKSKNELTQEGRLTNVVRAKKIVDLISDFLKKKKYPEAKSVNELGNTSKGLLEKLLEALQ